MRRLLARAAGAAALVALGAAGAAAQDTPDPRTEAEVHAGPFYLTPRAAVKEFGVDTNVFNNADEKQDFTFTLTPRADVWVPMARRALLTTSVATDLVYYQTYASERSVNPEVKLRGDLFLGRVSPFAEGGYLRTRQRANYEIDARSEREERLLRAGVGVRITPKLSMELAASQAELRYASDATFNDVSLRDTLNRDVRGISASVRHAVTPLTTLVLRAERGSERFQFSPLRNADSLRVMPGVEFKPIALVSGSAFVGFRRFEPVSGALQPFSGLTARGALSYTLLGATRFTADIDRDVAYSYEVAQPYYVVDAYGLTVRRQLVGRTDVTGGFHRSQYSYRDLLVPGSNAPGAERADVTRTWRASFGYRLGQGTRVGVGVLRMDRRSNSARFRDYAGLRFLTTLDYEL